MLPSAGDLTQLHLQATELYLQHLKIRNPKNLQLQTEDQLRKEEENKKKGDKNDAIKYSRRSDLVFSSFLKTKSAMSFIQEAVAVK